MPENIAWIRSFVGWRGTTQRTGTQFEVGTEDRQNLVVRGSFSPLQSYSAGSVRIRCSSVYPAHGSSQVRVVCQISTDPTEFIDANGPSETPSGTKGRGSGYITKWGDAVGPGGDGTITFTEPMQLNAGITYYIWVYPSGHWYDWANESAFIEQVSVDAADGAYLDLNGWINGSWRGDISGCGTCDVYINGTKVGNGVSDWYQYYAAGTTYNIDNIQHTSNYTYDGVYSGSLSGTIGDILSEVVLNYNVIQSPMTVSVTATAYNTNSTVNSWGIYLQNYSQANIYVQATGANGSAITNYTVKIGSSQVWSGTSSAGRSSIITSSGNITITATVTDALGTTGTATAKINVKPYANPNLTNIQCYRCNSSGTAATNGTYLYFSGTPTFSSAGDHNTCTTSFKYGASGGSMSGYTTISNPTTWQRIASGLSTTSTYSVVFKVADALGNYREFSITIPTELVTMNFKDGGTGVCFGSYATKDNCFEIANAQGWKAVISNGMYGDTLPTSGNTEGQIFFKSIPNTALYPLQSDAPPTTATVNECKAFAVQHPNQIFVWAKWQPATYTPGGVSGCWVYTLYTTYTYESTTSYTVFIARNLSTGQEFLAKTDGSWVEH